MADSKELDNVDESSKLNADSDTGKIKFQQSTNGEAKVDMPDGTAGYGQCGLTKEELMKFANDPFWICLRRFLLILFWLLWVGMLVGAVVIIIMTPGCAKIKEPEWYENSLTYELDLKTFDQNATEPNIQTIMKRLPQLGHEKGLSVSAIVVGGLFDPAKPGIIDPKHGSFDDFAELASKIKVILKLPLNKVGLSESTMIEFANKLKFWLEKGAAGFVFDELELIGDSVRTIDAWQKLVGNYSTEESPRVVILSSYDKYEVPQSFCNNFTQILNFKLTRLPRELTVQNLHDALIETTSETNGTCLHNLVLSNSDVKPLISRHNQIDRDRLIMFTFMANAAPFIYAGEEIAKGEANLPATPTRGENSHTPIAWSDLDPQSMSANSFYRVYANSARLRYTEKAILMGTADLKMLAENGTQPDVLAMARLFRDNPGFVVVTNFADKPRKVDLRQLSPKIPDTGEIDTFSTSTERKRQQKVSLASMEIMSNETLIIRFAPKKK